MDNYTITHCTVADGAAIARSNISAFWGDPHWYLEWRHRTLEQHIIEVAKQSPRDLLDDDCVTKRHQKVVDKETGCILGYARWKIPPSHATNPDGTPAWSEAVVPAVGPDEEAEIRRIANTALMDARSQSTESLAPLRKVRNEILARKSYMRLDYLAVHPEHQGKGVGSALVQSGMRQAEKLGLDIFIQAMKAGLGVYKRLGFHVDKEFIENRSEQGGKGDSVVYFMIYEQDPEIR